MMKARDLFWFNILPIVFVIGGVILALNDNDYWGVVNCYCFIYRG